MYRRFSQSDRGANRAFEMVVPGKKATVGTGDAVHPLADAHCVSDEGCPSPSHQAQEAPSQDHKQRNPAPLGAIQLGGIKVGRIKQ